MSNRKHRQSTAIEHWCSMYFDQLHQQQLLERTNNNASNVLTARSDSFNLTSYDSNSSTSLLNNEFVQTLCSSMQPTSGSQSEMGSSLIKYCYPIILLFGLFGNAITFVVMCRVHKRKRNFQKFSLSLGTLALVDISVLLFGCFVEYLEEVGAISVKSYSLYTCKLTLFACYLFSCYSAYLHGFIAIERWHAISSPLNSITKFTFKRNRLILLAIFIICAIINLHLLWFPSLNKSVVVDHSDIGIRIVDECTVAQPLLLFLIDSLFYFFLPFLFTIFFSILTLIKLTRLRSSQSSTPSDQNNKNNNNNNAMTNKQRSSCVNGEISSPSSCRSNNLLHYTSNKFNNSTSNYTNHKLMVFKLDKNHSSSITSRRTPPKSNFKLTLMLMALPISYLVTTFPIFLIVIHGCILHLRNKDNNNWSGFINHTDDFQLAYALAKIAMYINNSINILFYILLGKNLRKDFLALLPFKRFHFEYKPASLAAEQCHSFSGSVYYDSTTAQHFYRQQNPQHRRISTQINSSRQLPIYKKTKEANFS